MKMIPASRFGPEPDDDRYCGGRGACCRWPAKVVFTPNSLQEIAALLDLLESGPKARARGE